MLVFAMLLGGAGNAYPWLEAILEVSALLLIGWTLRSGTPPTGMGRAFLLFWGCCLAVPLLQLVPLPPIAWRALPGRALAAQLADLTNTGGQWRPFSLDPERTLGAALALLAPGAMLLAVVSLPARSRWHLVWIVLGCSALSLALGMAQLAVGSDGPHLSYETLHRDYAVGLFVNRNHQATLLLVAMMLSAVVGVRLTPGGGPRRLLALVYPALMAAGVVGTASRTGTLLLALVGPATFLVVFHDRLTWRGVGTGAVVLIAAALALAQSDAGRRTLARFAAKDDARSMFWADTVAATTRYFPAGSGTGTFRIVQPIDEPLAFVSPRVPNNAHNDYLELLMDSGAAAIAGFAAFAILFGAATRRAIRRPADDGDRLLAIGGLGGIAIVLLCSVTDYPLRMTALTTLFGLLAGLCAPSPPERDGNARASTSVARTAVFAAMLSGVGLLSMLYAASIDLPRRAGFRSLSDHLVWASSAPATNATDDLLAGRFRSAAAGARVVLGRSPLNASALRTAALAEEQLGDASFGRRVMPVAGRLGWRDRFTQYWLMEHGFRSGRTDVALMRTDALLRQDVFKDELFAMLHRAIATPDVRAALARRLAARPAWAEAYLTDVAALSPAARIDHADLLLLLHRDDPELADPFAGTLADVMLAGGQAMEARGFWGALYRPAALYDGGFDLLAVPAPHPRGPFAWKASTASNVYVTAEPPPWAARGPALHVRGAGTIVDPIVSQIVSLPPGPAVLRYRAAAANDDADAAILWRLRCPDGTNVLEGARVRRTEDGRWRWYAIAIDIPPQGCAVQDLQLGTSTPDAAEAWIDDLTLR